MYNLRPRQAHDTLYRFYALVFDIHQKVKLIRQKTMKFSQNTPKKAAKTSFFNILQVLNPVGVHSYTESASAKKIDFSFVPNTIIINFAENIYSQTIIFKT